ncbi:tripartite tricarboxylate transporter TctB family protein [Citricoccus muralis]|uniref:Tripartite tricarboxylate transporter TctB family protein n=1 Tax=Citricoccus muralis TaxID=169134 RepID=A0ABY8H6D0_9MICC|nr:tripartite tricarboxylate transporter TctB family protein [Citricoccus muralis]WFP16202.1 tripartite tricarboxylate transporter TctB family protein [Citricoccus muralis]
MRDRISYIGIAGVIVGTIILFSVSGLPNLSALFPRTIAWVLIVIGVIEMIRNFVVGTRDARDAKVIERDQSDYQEPIAGDFDEADADSRGPIKPVIIFAVVTIAYVALIPVVGFYVMTLAFLTGLMLALGIRNVLLYLGVPVILTAIIYLTFTMQLSVPLPEGVLL